MINPKDKINDIDLKIGQASLSGEKGQREIKRLMRKRALYKKLQSDIERERDKQRDMREIERRARKEAKKHIQETRVTDEGIIQL